MNDIPSSFGVGNTTLIQAYLTTSVSATSGSSVLSIGNPSSSNGSALGALGVIGGSTSNQAGDSGSFIILSGASQGSGAGATTAALGTGRLSKVQHKVIQAVAGAGAKGLTTDWNANGSEPSVLAAMRNLGWLKLTRKGLDTATRSRQGTYVLTPVGKRIAARTGGAAIGASGSGSTLSNSVLNGGTGSSTSTTAAETAKAQAAYSTEVSTAASLLSSLGVNVSL